MGDIRSRPSNRAFRDHYDESFGKKPGGHDNGPRCRICGQPGTPTNPVLIGHLHHGCAVQLNSEYIRRIPGR